MHTRQPTPPIPPRVRLIVAVSLAVGRGLIWLAGWLPESAALRVGGWVTQAFEPLTRERRHRNLRRFYGPVALTGDWLDALDAAHQRYLARMRTEIARTFTRPPREILDRVTLEGEEHLRSVLAGRRGALLISGHTGTWWLTPAYLVARGYSVTGIFTAIPFPSVERQLRRLTDRFGVRLAFVGRSAAKAALRAVEQNEIIFLTFDVAVRGDRCHWLRFGDGWLPIDPGPAQLALRRQMPVVQAACAHAADRRHLIRIYPAGPPLAMPTPEALSQQWLDRLATEVHDHPEQWWPWGYGNVEDHAP